QYLGCWLRNIFFVSFLAIVSFLYMGMYWSQHQTVINDNPNQPGIERWASAYIYGVDLPSIIALSLIIFISLLSHFQNTFVGDPRTFLEGGIALLVFSSTAATICIDHFTFPFL